MEYHSHRKQRIHEIFEIKFAGLPLGNSRILFKKDYGLFGFPSGFTRFFLWRFKFFLIN